MLQQEVEKSSLFNTILAPLTQIIIYWQTNKRTEEYTERRTGKNPLPDHTYFV